MNNYRYYITVTNNSSMFKLEMDTSDRKNTSVMYLLTAHEPFHLDTPEGLIELHNYFDEHGWLLRTPTHNTNECYSCEIVPLQRKPF